MNFFLSVAFFEIFFIVESYAGKMLKIVNFYFYQMESNIFHPLFE
jgi:hypothetical protein